MMKRIISYVYYYGTVCPLHMIFELERVSTNLQCDGDGLALVNVTSKNYNTVPEPNGKQSDAGGIDLVPARLRPPVTLYGMHQLLARIHTYCQYHVHFCCFQSDFIGYYSQGIRQQIITNPENTHHLEDGIFSPKPIVIGATARAPR